MTSTANSPSEAEKTVTFQPPVMHRRTHGRPSGPIFTPTVCDDADLESSDGSTPVGPALLFETESEAMATWDLTAEGVRALFGPPIPAGVVWDEPVWPIAQMELIYDEYVRPVFRRLHLDRDADVKDFFYWTKGTPVPLTRAEEESRRRWRESPEYKQRQANADQRKPEWPDELTKKLGEENPADGD